MERLCKLNTANLTRTHLLQSQYKTPWIMFRGRSRSHILGSPKSRRATAYYMYCTRNNVGLGVGNFEGKVWDDEIQDFDNPTVIERLLSRQHLRIFTQTLYYRKVDSLNYILPQTVCVCLYSNFCGQLRKMILFRRGGVSAVQGHPRSINFVPIESAYQWRNYWVYIKT